MKLNKSWKLWSDKQCLIKGIFVVTYASWYPYHVLHAIILHIAQCGIWLSSLWLSSIRPHEKMGIILYWANPKTHDFIRARLPKTQSQGSGNSSKYGNSSIVRALWWLVHRNRKHSFELRVECVGLMSLGRFMSL
jgi:hypothetical protein